MSGVKENFGRGGGPIGSRVATITVEQGEKGAIRIVLDGTYMNATIFEPGDLVEAIVQPDLISIMPLSE